MKKLICLTILILLSGCSSTTPTGKSTSKQPATSTVTSHVKPTKKTVSKATLSTLIGHAFVQVDNRKKAIRVTSSTSGYYLESTDQGIFAAQLTLKSRVFTFTGKAQPQAASSTLQFQLTKKGQLKQLPNGPVYKKVPQDDLDHLAQP